MKYCGNISFFAIWNTYCNRKNRSTDSGHLTRSEILHCLFLSRKYSKSFFGEILPQYAFCNIFAIFQKTMLQYVRNMALFFVVIKNLKAEKRASTKKETRKITTKKK